MRFKFTSPPTELLGISPLEFRFWSYVELGPNGCWLWTGTIIPSGYGILRQLPRRRDQPQIRWLAHRFAWEVLRGRLPRGMDVHHLCSVKRCVNPDHLEPLSKADHIRTWNHEGSKTHCPQGHPYDLLNTRWSEQGERVCRVCRICARKRHYDWRDRQPKKKKQSGYKLKLTPEQRQQRADQMRKNRLVNNPGMH
jgi:hypothetical protein